MKKVYLVGYMGCGKSALGKRISFATKLPFYDMDTEIVKKTGLTIPEIFEKHGEEYFRQLETDFLLTFRDEYCIIATGGGVPLRERNREIMRKTGIVFFLNAPFRDIWRRIATDRKSSDCSTVITQRIGKYLYITKTHLFAISSFYCRD